MPSVRDRTVLVTGASGFIGRALVPALRARGYRVRAASRHGGRESAPGLEWVRCDALRLEDVRAALEGVGSAYYLVHSMGAGAVDFAERDRRAARIFADAAADADIARIVYLGGVAPRGTPSEHLASRLEVGLILRSGSVPTIELRASMIIGNGSASWRIVRDLALRLPAMVLPAWLRSRTCPVALDDVVLALVDALEVPLADCVARGCKDTRAMSAWFDLPGPETLTGEEILLRVAALERRRILALRVPVLTPRLSATWLKLVTRADYGVARELVLGLEQDLLPRDARYWELTRHPPRIGFDEAALRAMASERAEHSLWSVEERLVRRFGPRLPRRA